MNMGAERLQFRHEAYPRGGPWATLAELALKKCFNIYVFF